MSEPTDARSCDAAAPTAYRVGSEDAPITNGKDEVLCSIHSTQESSWFSGRLAGPEASGAHVVFSISTEHGLAVSMASDLTRTLELDSAAGAACTSSFTAIVGDAVSAEFDCPLLVDPSDATNGCGVAGTVTFENCTL